MKKTWKPIKNYIVSSTIVHYVNDVKKEISDDVNKEIVYIVNFTLCIYEIHFILIYCICTY